MRLTGRNLVVLGLLLGLVAGAARADTIYFVHGMELECKITETTPLNVVVMKDNNRLVIDRKTIKKLSYDYESRLATIKKDDFLATYELGVWCEGQIADDERMIENALSCYLSSVGKEKVPFEVWLRLGRMWEKSRNPDLREALAAYEKYLEHDKENAEAKAAVARLSKDKKVTEEKPAVVEGLESIGWRHMREENPGSANTLVDKGQNSNRVLQIEFKPGPKEKTGASRTVVLDCSKKKSLLMDVYNAGPGEVNFALAIVTGQKYEWFESNVRKVPPGQWRVNLQFDLTRPVWKCAATGWKFKAAPSNLNRVRLLALLVYNTKGTGKVYFDSIRFEE